MKKVLITVFTVFILIFAVLFIFKNIYSDKRIEKSTVYAVVNGENITNDEIEYFKSRDKAEIINQFAEKYGITDFADFWEKDFNGNSPEKALEKKALSDAVEAKIKLVLMRDNGIYDDISFEGLKEKAERYNAEHKGKKGTVGISTVDLSSFYTYYVSTGEMELKNILAEGDLKPAREEIDSLLNDNSELTENGVISMIVSEKYDEMIKKIISTAKTELK